MTTPFEFINIANSSALIAGGYIGGIVIMFMGGWKFFTKPLEYRENLCIQEDWAEAVNRGQCRLRIFISVLWPLVLLAEGVYRALYWLSVLYGIFSLAVFLTVLELIDAVLEIAYEQYSVGYVKTQLERPPLPLVAAFTLWVALLFITHFVLDMLVKPVSLALLWAGTVLIRIVDAMSYGSGSGPRSWIIFRLDPEYRSEPFDAQAYLDELNRECAAEWAEYCRQKGLPMDGVDPFEC